MAETTNPNAGVEQAPTDPVSRMANFIAQSEDQERQEAAEQPEQTEKVPQQQPEDQVTEEVSPDDLEVEATPDEQSAVDAFEIVHQGQQVKLSREETIKYAQQGFDYTRKVQAVAEKDRQVGEHLQRLAQIEQVTPILQNQLAQVKALEAQLAPYQSVNWVQLATDNPLEYPKYRAQYDVLVQGYQQAVGQYQQAQSAVGQEFQRVRLQRLQAEAARLPDIVPEWRDPKRLETSKADIARHYQSTYGIDPRVLDSRLDDAFAMAVVYKAMKYDQLVKAKGEKTNLLRNKPPVTVPGAAQSSTAKADKEQQLRQRLKKSGTAQDAVAILLNRMG